MFRYAAKRVSLSAKLFAALLIATTLGTTFFTGAVVASNLVTGQATRQALNSVPVDFYVNPPFLYAGYTHSIDLLGLNQSASGVAGINGTEIVSYCTPSVEGKLSASSFSLVGVQDNSLITRGMQLETGSQPLGVNETYVCTDSPDLKALSAIGMVLTLNLTGYDRYGTQYTTLWNLTVKGVISLSDRGLSIAKQQFYNYYGSFGVSLGPYIGYQVKSNILIVSWSRTFSRLMNVVGGFFGITSGVLAYVDHDQLANSYDIESSINVLNMISARLQNAVSSGAYVEAFVIYALYSYSSQLMSLRLAIIGAAVLVFLLVWYMGSTGSEVSFNLRRREVGLLSVRGFTKRNIMRLFLTEALLIGIISGIIGFILGIVIVPLTLGQAIPSGLGGLELVFANAGLETVGVSLVVGIVLSVLTVYRAAGKASGMKTIDALKEYTYVEEPKKPFKSRWVWLAFILGTYKMIAWIVGLNLYSFVYTLPNNILLYIVFAVFLTIDGILSSPIVGPVLFLYGTVRLFTQGSIRLQRKIGSAGRRAFGDTGLLATRSVQRNPARTIAVAFLVALIVGYGVMTIGVAASNYDYQYRNIYTNVGADASTYMLLGSNVTYLSTQVANISGVSGITEQSYVYPIASGYGITLRAVDPTRWLEVAYYEEGWFRGASAEQAFKSMTKDNFTIILDSGVAEYLSLGINNTISMTFSTAEGQRDYSFRVVGFFGPPPALQSGLYGNTFSLGYYSQFWSYIPAAALNEINATSNSDQILIKLNANTDAASVVKQLNSIQNTSNTQAAKVQLAAASSNFMVTGSQDVQTLGIALALVAASVEVSVVVAITTLEKKRELTLLSVRGMSSRQISSMLLLENLSVVGFALSLGVAVGLIITLGTANSTQFSSFFQPAQLVTARLVLPLGSLLLIVAMLMLVVVAVTVPLVVAARRASSNARKKGEW